MGSLSRIDKIIASENVLLPGRRELVPAAIAVSGSRICAVGTIEEMRCIASDAEGSASVEDLGDACIYPGFHDAHMHVFHSALYSSPLAADFIGDNEQDCVRRMQELAAVREDGWLLAQGWREYRWDVPLLPTKRSLDAAFPNRPVALYSGDAHTLWLNTAAMIELGISDDSEPVEGGYYGRFEDGSLTGIVGEAAAMQLMPKIVSNFTDQEILDAYRRFFRTLASRGIVSLCDMSLMPGRGMDFIRDDIYSMLLDSGDLTARVSMFPTLQEDLSRFEKLRLSCEDPLLRACGLKHFFDGVSSQHTAWLHDDYSNAANAGDRGRPTVDPAEMRKLVLNANERGYPVRIHAIGDEAVHVALDIFAESKKRFGALPDDARNCIEHLEDLQPDDIARFAELDALASVQPAHMTLDPGGPEKDLGPDRLPYMWPFDSLLRSGAVLAFGTDSPVVPVDPLDNIYTAVTREDAASHEPAGGWIPEEKIDRLQAIYAYTAGSAAAAQRPREMGSIAEGMFADLVALDENLLECDAEDIQKAEVIATYVGGIPVYAKY